MYPIGSVVRLCLITCLLFPGTLTAAIHLCPSADGGVTFQDRPCAREVIRVEQSTTVSKVRPARMHDSWFEKPALGTGEANCTEEGCRCQHEKRPFQSGIELAVADALYLDGNWHRYDSSVEALDKSKKNSPEYRKARLDVEEAACEVMMSQQILMKYTQKSLASMRVAAREAENRGHDDPAECNNGDIEACRHVDALELYRRVQGDIRSLRHDRHADSLVFQ